MSTLEEMTAVAFFHPCRDQTLLDQVADTSELLQEFARTNRRVAFLAQREFGSSILEVRS